MIESLAKIIYHVPGAANHACCTAHIVNQSQRLSCGSSTPGKKILGAKKTLENENDKAEPDNEDDFTSLAEDLDREEQNRGREVNIWAIISVSDGLSLWSHSRALA